MTVTVDDVLRALERLCHDQHWTVERLGPALRIVQTPKSYLLIRVSTHSTRHE